MSQKVINREDVELLFVSKYRDGIDELFIVYYVTTNDINFYRMNYPIDSILNQAISDGNFDTNSFLLGAIERKHNLNKRVTFEQLNLNIASWGPIAHKKAVDYHKQQLREIKINQII